MATFANPDTFAFLPLTALFLCVALLEGRGRDAPWWVAGIVLLFAFLLVGGRTASGALVAGLLALLGVSRARWLASISQEETPKRPLTGCTLFAGLVILAIVLALVRPQLPSLSQAIGDTDTQKLRLRRDILWQAGNLAPARPVTGSGPGTFTLAYQEVRGLDLLPDGSPVETAQNDFVETIVESGFPGLLLWGLILLVSLFQAYSRAMMVIDPLAPGGAQEALGALAALVAALTFSLLFSVITVPAALCWMTVLLALAGTAGERDLSEPPRQLRPLNVAAAILLIVAGLWVMVFTWHGATAAREVARATTAAGSLLLEEAQSSLDRALQYAPGWWFPHLRKAQVLRLLADERQDKQVQRKAIEELELARRCSPREIDVLAALGQACLEAGEPARAAETYAMGVRYAPYHDGFKRGLLNAYLLRGQLDRSARQALALYRRDPGQVKLASVIVLALATRNNHQAIELLKQAGLSEDSLKELLAQTHGLATRVGLPEFMAPLYTAWLDTHPQDWITWLYQAKLLLEAGQEEEAFAKIVELRRQVPPKDPAAAEVLCAWASLAAARGQALEARVELDKQLTQDPELAPVRRLLVRFLVDAGQLEKARYLIDGGLEINPTDAELLTLKARIFLEGGDPEAALKYAGMALSVQPGAPEALEIRRKAMAGMTLP